MLPQRQTVLVAKQAAELQLLSNGRLRIGVGVGWNPEEYRALGMNFHDRGKRVVDQIELIRRLWKDDLVSEEGTYHRLRRMALNPRPMLRPIPIWIGGSAPVAIKRAAAVAHGFVLDHSITDAPAVLRELRGYLREFRRDVEPFGFAARLQLSQGGFDESVAEARAWRALGITHLSVNTMNAGLPDPHLHLDLATGFLTAWRKTDS